MIKEYNKYNSGITMLAFCSAFTQFMMSEPDTAMFPKERICGIVISCLISFLLALIINIINFKINIFRYIALSMIFFRLVYMVYRYVQYYQTFYGSGSAGIILLTITVAALLIVYKNTAAAPIYDFFLISNILMIFALIIMSAGRLNAANIYSLYSINNDCLDTASVFFDVFTIAVFAADKKDRVYMQKNFLLAVLFAFTGITLLQGLCIKGNLLYSLSPLQALVQIFSGEVVKRYDYFFAVMFTVNYFGAIMLYVLAAIKLIDKEKAVEKN